MWIYRRIVPPAVCLSDGNNSWRNELLFTYVRTRKTAQPKRIKQRKTKTQNCLTKCDS